MKHRTHSLYIIFSIFFLLAALEISEARTVKGYPERSDSTNCNASLSLYREFIKLKLFDYARDPWLKAFNNCPESSLKMYVDGVTIYRNFLETAPDGPNREGLIDTLMLIYDRRMEYFGDEGNVLGRKGIDLLTYRNSDMAEVERAYQMLKRSLTIEGNKSREPVMLLFITAGTMMHNKNQLTDNQVIEDYIALVMILDQLEGRSSRWKKTRQKLDQIVLRESILSCEALDRYFEPQVEQNKGNVAFLENLTTLYSVASCENSSLYVAAMENLYKIEPGPEYAHDLAMMFISRNDNQKAASYLKEAVQGEVADTDKKAQWYYELALVNQANKDYCDAITAAREAIRLKSDYGPAYMVLGDSYIASRDNLGDDFQQGTAFWAATDMYRKAATVDPSLAEESNRKLAEALSQYPDSEEVFFRDIRDGDPYRVEGCINETTTVRSGA